AIRWVPGRRCFQELHSSRQTTCAPAVAGTIHAFGTEAIDPFADGLRGRIELVRSRGFGHAAIRNGTHHFLSTFRGQASILMGVHSVLRESLRFGNIRVPGSGRMDNLPKVHS